MECSARRSGLVDVHPSDTQRDSARDQRFRDVVLPELEVLYGVAMRLTRNPHDAEDVVQDTLLRAFRALDSFDGRYPRAWLLTILRNTNINRVRKRTPDLLFDEDQTFGALPGLGADGREGAAETALERIPDRALVDALKRLSGDHRAVVALVDIDGLSYQEAADLLGVPIGTVMSRLHRARRKLRDRLERNGHFEGAHP